jgi:hypothetical protein
MGFENLFHRAPSYRRRARRGTLTDVGSVIQQI